MLVVIDANVVMNDPLFRDHKWEVAKQAIAEERLRVLLPAVVRLEAIGGFQRSHRAKISAVNRELKKSSGRAKAAAKALLQVYAEELDGYEAILDARLDEIGVEVPGPPDSAHLDLTQRAVQRIPPFDDKGGGYRDTLLWLTALEEIDDPPFDGLTLVSNDKIFTNRQSDLQTQLSAEGGGQLTVLRALFGLEFPGEYEDGEFSLEDIPSQMVEIESQIGAELEGLDITTWSPPGPDQATVEVVKSLELLPDTVEVKKRYGSNVFELHAEAFAEIEAKVFLVELGYDDVPDFREFSANWTLHFRWQGDVEGGTGELVDEGEVTVRYVDDGFDWERDH